jgi:hypothetical protein
MGLPNDRVTLRGPGGSVEPPGPPGPLSFDVEGCHRGEAPVDAGRHDYLSRFSRSRNTFSSFSTFGTITTRQ